MSRNDIDDNVTDKDDCGDAVCEEENDEEKAQITSMWDHPLIQKYKKANGKKFWKCLAVGCGKEY